MALIQACLRNAGDLLADARRLLENGRPTTAHAMATLAFEEIGKSCMCMLALLPQSPLPFFGFQGQENVAIHPGRTAAGSQGPVVKSWVSASRASMPHLVAVDR
jgi:AbiV